MKRHDAHDANLESWLESEAEAPIPAGMLDGALKATAARKPRPALVAGLGSNWTNRDPSGTPSDARRMTFPTMRLSARALALLLLALLVGAAVLAGSRFVAPHRPLGLLVYALDGQVFLANVDGANARQVAGGNVESRTSLATGATWAPDGRHFVYLEERAPSDGGITALISDATGRIVASIPDSGRNLGWSPDSKLLAAWPDLQPLVRIFGLDGMEQRSIAHPHPEHRYREAAGLWLPDGASVRVIIVGPLGREVWTLPMDGSDPRGSGPVPSFADRPFPLSSADLSFSPDGRRVAFSNAEGLPGPSLFVAAADGSDVRALVDGINPLWSPTGEMIAYLDIVPDLGYEIRIVDVESRLDLSPVPGLFHEGWPPFGWSAAGDRLLYPYLDDLWSVNVDGTDKRLLVSGTNAGAWQPTQR